MIKPLGSRLFVWLLSALTAGVLAIVVALALVPDGVVFPSPAHFSVEAYTDMPNGGNSRVTRFDVSDSLALMAFRFGEAFHSPYVGICLTPDEPSGVDVSMYNRMSVEIQGIQLSRVGIALYTTPDGTSAYAGIDESLYHSYLNITDQRAVYHLPLTQFKHPEWWEDVHGISSETRRRPDLTRLLHVNIGSAFTPQLDGDKQLRIYAVTFSRDNRGVYLWLGGIYVWMSALLCVWRFRRVKAVAAMPGVTVAYRPVALNEPAGSGEACLEYLNAHYHLSDLTLEKVAAQTGTSPRRITQLMNDRYGCHFKSYLNRIRITEAKRLLAQADLNMGEIAFRVGFNNQTHFNRVFKSECGVNPSEFREQLRGRAPYSPPKSPKGGL
ncbi:MAG: helix-turn-helix transcriptional regulator [Marinilabiliaceae bacterium]|nr:helix-turn-helix transcriptional regulator [Marinilabiliaceae bacterium]